SGMLVRSLYVRGALSPFSDGGPWWYHACLRRGGGAGVGIVPTVRDRISRGRGCAPVDDRRDEVARGGRVAAGTPRGRPVFCRQSGGGRTRHPPGLPTGRCPGRG